jgi:hypothetical protein
LDNESDLKLKVERLQRDLFWSKIVATLLFLCLAAASLANWKIHPKKLVADELVLRDPNGNVSARLGQDYLGGTCLTLSAKKNISVASLCVEDDEGASLDLYNLKSDSPATLTPGFKLHEPNFPLAPMFLLTGHGQILYRIPSHSANGESF